jgi:trimethylamine--corrinoid protein Co-methyltransferase
MMHGAGWLEGGLRCSYEKMILDIDLLQMVAEFLTPLDLSEDALAVEAIRDVGPGGHFSVRRTPRRATATPSTPRPVGLAQL